MFTCCRRLISLLSPYPPRAVGCRRPSRCRVYSQAATQPRNTSKDGALLGTALRERVNAVRANLADIHASGDWRRMQEQVNALKASLEDDGIWVSEAAKALNIQTRMARLQKQLSTYQVLETESAGLFELADLANTESDAEMQQEVLGELDSLQARSESYLESLWLSDPVDENSAFIDIHAGSGGTEACDWAEMLSRMYTRWANSQRHTVEVVDESPGDVAGVKSLSLLVKGAYAYGYTKYESGVHRLVRISPFDASKARHTSFASVRVSPHFEENQDIGIEIRPSDLNITTMRSQGAGGQHVNKTESAVRIVHIPTGITVACQQERSQHKNKALALARLKTRLYEQEVQKQARAKQEAYETLPENAWGSQVRSYVLQPYQLVKDARTGFETNNAQNVLDGDIEGFLKASLKRFKARKS